MIELMRFIRSKLALSRLVVLGAAALLGGVVVTGVLAGPNGLLAGPGGDEGDTPQEVATSTPTPTPEPGTEIVGDVIDCPSGEDTRFKFEQEGGEFEVTGLLVSLDGSSVVVTGPDGD